MDTQNPLIPASMLRFIIFDGSGLVLLLMAWVMTAKKGNRKA